MLTALGVEDVVVSWPVEEVEHGLLVVVVGEAVGGGLLVVATVKVDHRHANTRRWKGADWSKKPTNLYTMIHGH